MPLDRRQPVALNLTNGRQAFVLAATSTGEDRWKRRSKIASETAPPRRLDIAAGRWRGLSERQVAGDQGVATAGLGLATSGDFGRSYAGDYGRAIAGDGGRAQAGRRGTATVGSDGRAQAGAEGTLIFEYHYNGRRHLTVGYIGLAGLEPPVLYTLDVEDRIVRAVARVD